MKTPETTHTHTRSRAYPAMPLGQAVDALRSVEGALSGGTCDRDALASALGYRAAGVGARKVAALGHFNLVERVGGLYQMSRLGRRIVSPISDRDRQAALVEAFMATVVFREVYEAYRRIRKFPRDLAAVLERDHGIVKSVAGEVAQVILESGVYAGILDVRGYYVGTDDVDASNDSGIPSPANSGAAQGAAVSTGEQRFELNVSGGRAVLVVPSHVTAGDLDKLRRIIDLISLDVAHE